MPELIDTIGVPEFVIDYVTCEVGPYGMIRVYGFSTRQGGMRLEYSAVLPREAMLIAARKCLEAAQMCASPAPHLVPEQGLH